MKFTNANSHVKRVRKSDIGKGSTVGAGRRVRATDYRKEAYVVQKDYQDPFTGRTYHKGEVIPNRQGRNIQVQETELGRYSSKSQYDKLWGRNARLNTPIVKTRTAYMQQGRGKTAEQLRNDPEFRKRFAEVYLENGRIVEKGNKSYTPRGNMHYLLVATGVRDPNATYAVGDTPDVKRKKTR